MDGAGVPSCWPEEPGVFGVASEAASLKGRALSAAALADGAGESLAAEDESSSLTTEGVEAPAAEVKDVLPDMVLLPKMARNLLPETFRVIILDARSDLRRSLLAVDMVERVGVNDREQTADSDVENA